MDELGIRNSHFVGISVGGMIGQTLAMRAPERIASLVLANTTPFMPPAASQAWMQRIELAQDKEVASLAGPSLERWFPQTFRTEHPDVIGSLARAPSRSSAMGIHTS
jgi:pimeloyl-ACP methyl ester carboxylesterase